METALRVINKSLQPKIYKYVYPKNMTFGFADNELLFNSDRVSCCNAADLYMKEASFFRANTTGLAKSKDAGKFISFDEYLKE